MKDISEQRWRRISKPKRDWSYIFGDVADSVLTGRFLSILLTGSALIAGLHVLIQIFN